MKKPLTIEDAELDAIIREKQSDVYAWDTSKIIIDGVLYYRKSIVNDEVSTKSTANSLIKKEPVFDYSFMDDIYRILDEHNIDQIFYARPTMKGGNCERDFQFQIDLYSAYPHILNYEKLPVDGTLYEEESADRMNFYVYHGKKLKPECLVTDDLKNYIEENNLGVCEFLFSTNYQTGSKIGSKLIEMVYKNKKTKAEAKMLHYGYYQKKFIQYDPEQDCYVRNPKYNHELLMVAVLSQLVFIMLNIADIIGKGGRFVTDAYFFKNEPDIDHINAELQSRFKNYDYRIIDTWQSGTEDKHGEILFKSYPDLKEAPRSHHKKK